MSNSLNRGMKARHLAMIAIGGTISASFFLGVGDLLHQMGSFGLIFGYLVGGFIMFLALLSLAEMSVAMPISGSFQAYATKFISPFIGYLTGWLYLLNWVTAAAASLTAAAMIVNMWYPFLASWQIAMFFIVVLSVLNFFPVQAYGELEFWFAGIKILAIIIFIFVGFGLLLGIIPENHHYIKGFQNFDIHNILPNGIKPFLFGIVMIVCTYQGAELVGIAAGESENPEKNIKLAIRNVGFRIILFFILSTFIITMIIPWQDASLKNSPFISIFQIARFKYVDTIMQAVILSASLSAVNSAFYACARLLWSMAHTQQAPRFFANTNKYNVPIYGIVTTAILSSICLLSKFIGDENLFVLIVSSSGMVGSIIWAIISWCHIGFRRYLKNENINPASLLFKVWGYPIVPYLSIVFNIMIILGMFYDPGQRVIVYSGFVIIILLSLSYLLIKKART